MKALIIGGNVEALVANYMLAEAGYDPLIAVERTKTQNGFVRGPWRPVGASPLLASILDDLGIEHQEHEISIGAVGIDDLGSEILDVETAVEREIQTTRLGRLPEFRATVTGRPTRELRFDRLAFFRELAMTASLDTEALRIDSADFGDRPFVWLNCYLGWFDLVLVTAPPHVWDPGHVVSDLSVTEVRNAPAELLPFDLIEFGGLGGFEAVTWRNGHAMVETSGCGLPDLDELARMLGVDQVGPEREVVDLDTKGARYWLGTTERVRREIGDVDRLGGVLALGREATGEPQTLSEVAERVSQIIQERKREA